MQDYRDADDEAIVRLVRNGNASAFGELVDRYKDKALSLTVRILKSEHEAEDALQEAFVKAYTSIATFRHESKFATWFYRIVYTTCLNILKKRSRTQPLTEFDDEVMLTQEAFGEHRIDERMDAVMIRETIAEEMASMPELYAAIIDLFYVQDCSHDDIVGITGLPLNTVKTRLNRGRQMLRQALLRKIPDLQTWTQTI